MRFSTISLQYLGFLFLSSLLITSCGSYQSASYYSDGIYSNDNVIVIRKSEAQPESNAYTQYFDEKAKQYSWEDSNETVVLTDVDSLNQGKSNNYQTNPNWGGGNSTTQIIIRSNPYPVGFVNNWGFGGFYDPYLNYWDSYTPFYWSRNRFAWEFNHWNWRFNRPFFSPFYPYYGNAFYDPYFYGGVHWNNWNGYAYHNHFNRPYRFNRQGHRNRRVAYSSSYRGQAARNGSGQRGNAAINRSASLRNNAQSTVRNSGRRSSRNANNATVPNLVERGRTASVRSRQNTSRAETSARRQATTEEARNRLQIDRVIRGLQNRGYNTQVINNNERARQANRRYQTRTVVNPNASRSSNYSNSRSNNVRSSQSSRKSYSNAAQQNYSRPAPQNHSRSSSNNNYRSSPSRSYSAPARTSAGSGRSSSSRSSSGRSSSGRRQ